VQVPTLPATPHASHCPLHAVSQQTPSAQLPDVHCPAEAHAAPLAFFAVHVPALQKSPAMQSASVTHVDKHAVDPHT